MMPSNEEIVVQYARFDGTDRVQRFDEAELPMPWPFPQQLEKLTGTLIKFKAVLSKGPFDDRFYSRIAALAQGKTGGLNQEELGAVMLGVAGLGVAAMTSMAQGPQFEPAMYIFAELDNKPLRGWLQYSEFKVGDRVEIAAEWTGEYYEVYAITRPKDEVVTVYPGCKNGLNAARIKVLYGFSLVSSISWVVLFLIIWALQGDWWEAASDSFVVVFVFWGIALIVGYRSLKKTQVVLAERIFSALGWQNVKNISLDYMLIKKNKEYEKEGKALERWDFESYNNDNPFESEFGAERRYYYYSDLVYSRKRR